MAKKKNKNRKPQKRLNPSHDSDNKSINKNPSISVCMIVKDEENFLENCLKSIKDIADEIIIVDTGSQDSTVEIAKKYTDKVYFHTWNDNFGEMRSYSLGYATGDWLFVIDADEELVVEDIPNLMKAVRNNNIDAIQIQVVSVFKKGENESRHNSERLFRNNGRIKYEGRVHNRAIGFENPKIYPVRIRHYGYDLTDKELSDKKHQRRIKLLKLDIQDSPNNPLPYHYLSCCYLPKGQYKETLEVSLKAIELSEQQNDLNPVFLWTRYNAAMAYYKLKDYVNAENIAQAALDINDYHIDSYFVLTLTSHEQKKWEDVIRNGKKYIELCKLFKKKPDEFGILVSSTTSMDWNVHVLMGISYFESGEKDKSELFFQKATKRIKNAFQVYRAAGLYLQSKGSYQKAIKYLEKAHKLNPDDSTVKNILTELKQKNSNKHTISCCMIVKNEEEFLDKCLSSVKDYVDELIIVDTGSTDSTVEIAKKYTNKIYFHPWENSFSKARNQALSYATGDWIFQIDGDEELMEGSGERLRKTVQESKNEDVINVKILCSYANGTKTSMHNFERLFRNNGVIHYEGRVHNRIVGYKNPRYSRIELWHYGYNVDEEKAQEKFERTKELLLKDIKEDPDNPLPHHYLSCSYLARGMFNEAIVEAKLAIQLADSTGNRSHNYAWSYFNVSFSLFKLGEYEKAQEYPLRALEIYPDNLDSYYMLTMIAGEKSEWGDVFKYGNNFIRIWKDHKNNPEKADLMIDNTLSEAPAIYTLMGHAHHAEKAFKKMDACYKKALDVSDEKWLTPWNIGGYHLDKSFDMDRAGHFLKLAVEEAPEEYNAWYMLAKYFNKRGLTDDEINALEKVVEIGTEENFIFNRLFSLYTQKELNDKAFELLNFIKNLDSSFYPYLLKLGNSFIEKGSLDSAFSCYMKAAEAEPERPEAWSILSEITYSLEKYEESQIFLEKALKLKGDDVTNLLKMCELKLKLGDIESNIRYCDKVLALLNLNRNRAINGFNDLKKIFIEINDSTGNDYSLKINSIISQLDSYISPSA